MEYKHIAAKTAKGCFIVIDIETQKLVDTSANYAENLYKEQYEKHRYMKAQEWAKNQYGNAGDD